MSSSTSPLVSNPTNKVCSTIVLKSLSILLGLFFIFIGAMKISPYLSKELHKDLVSYIGFCESVSVFVFIPFSYTSNFHCQIENVFVFASIYLHDFCLYFACRYVQSEDVLVLINSFSVKVKVI